MGIFQWRFIFAAVALLLDPTFADILVQPGYGQPGQSSKKSVVENSYYKNQQAENSQQNYVQQQNPSIQLLQQQHMVQQQQLQNLHQQEHNQLLQLQQQQLQDPAMHPIVGDEVVGTSWGLPHPMYVPPFGSVHGGKIFSLGPFGLNSFKMGGLRGMGGPLLLTPQQAPETTGSNVLQKSMDSSAESRAKRDVRDPGESTGRKFRQKTSRQQQDGMAEDPTLKSKHDATTATPNAQSSKTDDDTVGDTQKNDEETVGSSLLDPLGLVEKTEGLIHNLKSGHYQNPMSTLNNGGHLPGLSNFLNSPKPGHPHIEEHVVGQTQQYQQFQPDQSQAQIVGSSRYSSYPMRPSSTSGQWGQQQSYGMYPQPYSSFGQSSSYGTYPQPYSSSGSSWMRSSNAMGPQGNQMAYVGNPMVGDGTPVAQQFRGQTYQTNYPMTDALRYDNGYPQMIGGVRNSMVGERQSSLMDSMYNRPNLGSTQGPKPTNSNFLSEPQLGMSPDKMTGRGVPGASNEDASVPVGGPVANGERNSMVGSPMMNNFDGPSRRMNNYYGFNDGSQRHRGFDIDDIFNGGYDQHHHGGYDRIYENNYDDSPFGFGGGYRPHHTHHQHSYF